MQRLDRCEIGGCDVLFFNRVGADVRQRFVLQGKNDIEGLGKVDFPPNVLVLTGDLHIRDRGFGGTMWVRMIHDLKFCTLRPDVLFGE